MEMKKTKIMDIKQSSAEPKSFIKATQKAQGRTSTSSHSQC